MDGRARYGAVRGTGLAEAGRTSLKANRSMSTEILPTRDAFGCHEDRRTIRRSHGLRSLGLALGAVMVGWVLHRIGAPASVWVLWFLHGMIWPHVVRWILHRSENPVADDRRCFMADTAMGGVWIALMQFNLLPSVILATTYAMTLIAIGGGGLLVRGFVLMALACAVTAVAGGLAFAPTTDMGELLASLPLLVVFPATLSIVIYRLHDHVRRQNLMLLRVSSVDSLSGLLNRRRWEEAVNAAMAHPRTDTTAMLLIDIDHFKRVNDQHGHAAGDEVIRRLGAIIRSNLRENDLAGRYGGDEFGVMLDGADEAAAELVAERIRSSVACTLLEHVPGMRCSVSIGIAHSAGGFRTAGAWMEEADAALYRAKLAGRNRFVVAN